MEIEPGVFVSETGTDAWEFDPEVNGDIHVLAGVDGVDSGMSRFTTTVDPVAYTPPKRETLLVLEGSARVEIAGGPTLELHPGVIASIPAGAETTWYITPPFKEFWVIA